MDSAAGIAFVTIANAFAGFAVGAVLLGFGTVMVYPTLLAAIGDVAHPTWRASAVRTCSLRNGGPGALADLALDVDRRVVTVCNTGKVSQTAADVLRQRGFDARSLSGGMKTWSPRVEYRACAAY